ncbi:hypothetical protein ACROYT_G004406 [Oculina patagonica]
MVAQISVQLVHLQCDCKEKKDYSWVSNQAGTQRESPKNPYAFKEYQSQYCFDKERAKLLHPTGKVRALKDENGQLKTQCKTITESRKLDKIKEDNLGKKSKLNDEGLCCSAEILNKDLIIQKDHSQLQLDGGESIDNVGFKNEGNDDEAKEGEFYKENLKENEQGDSNCSKTGEERSEVNDLTGNLKSQPSSQKLIQAEMTSAQTQKISDFPASYQELQAWHRSLETRIFNSGKDFNATNRLKSASLTGYRKDIDIHEACAISTRPQSA